ncbi:hypothetical protein DRO66_07525 [Candidatus Bathyarchaeota archaeon]|nr:MAG: hypothetical protein DRO66_07525 [Candidatus Bathyarchaeota archaeon]
MIKKNVFWLFGGLQSITLGVIIFLIFNSLNMISDKVIGVDTQILLSVLFPLFLLIVEYLIFLKD